MKSALIVIPSTGAKVLSRAVKSALAQSYSGTKVLVVFDGPEALQQHKKLFIEDNVHNLVLPWNVGKDDYYGHRVYAAMCHLTNADYTFFLDQDNFFSPTHVETLVTCMDSVPQALWGFALRNICTPDGTLVCPDLCESLGPKTGPYGYQLIDTNCYCLTREIAPAIANLWHGQWGQDRVVASALLRHYPGLCSGQHTVNYCYTEGRAPGPEYWLKGNALMAERELGPQ